MSKAVKELKDRYIDIVVSEVWSDADHWRKYYKSEIERVFQTEKGYLIALDKPRIQKDFCFGYHDSRYDTDDFDRANDMAYHAKTSTDYFLSENLKQVDRQIKHLEDKRYNLYTKVGYCGAPADSLIHCLEFVGVCEDPDSKLVPLSDADRALLINEYKELRKSFEKRLHTYLKRYGLSKVNSWSYWADR